MRIFFLVFWLLSTPLFALTLQDDTGVTFTLTGPAQRIVSLTPSTTENLYSIGAGARIVGTSRHSDYPLAAQKIALIGDEQSINLERIAALKPDLIIAWAGGTSPAQLAALQQLQIPIFMQRIQTLPDIPLALMRLAQLTGLESQAAPIILKSYQDINLLNNVPQPTLTAFYQIWHAPLMTLNRSSWVSDALTRCGALNLFASAPITAPTVNVEHVLRQNPDLIITGTNNATPNNSLDSWRAWPDLQAVQKNGLLFVNDDHMSRATLRTLSASTQLCQKIDTVRHHV